MYNKERRELFNIFFFMNVDSKRDITTIFTQLKHLIMYLCISVEEVPAICCLQGCLTACTVAGLFFIVLPAGEDTPESEIKGVSEFNNW